jgi:hypothetical protein
VTLLRENCLDLPARRRDLELEAANCNARYLSEGGIVRPASLVADEFREIRASLRLHLASQLRDLKAARREGVWPDLLVFVYPAVAVVGASGIMGTLAARLARWLTGA